MTDLLIYLIYITPFLAFLALAGWAADRLAEWVPDVE